MSTPKKRAMTLTTEQVDAIVDRYTRGQGLKFIGFALSHSRETMVAALKARGVAVKKPGRSASRNWGYTGSAS